MPKPQSDINNLTVFLIRNWEFLDSQAQCKTFVILKKWTCLKFWLHFTPNLFRNSKLARDPKSYYTKHPDSLQTTWYYTVKFRKWAPGLIFFKSPFWGAYFWRGLSTEGNLRLKIDWASLCIVGSKFIVFALIDFVFEGIFPKYKPPPGGLYLKGRFNGGFFALPVWGAYIWRGSRGLFSQFYGIIGRKWENLKTRIFLYLPDWISII